MKIVADPNIPYVHEAFAGFGTTTFIPGREMTAVNVRGADCLLVRSVTQVNANLLDGGHVRFVATATIGTDHIDQAYLAQRHIGFASAAGSNANSVAEYIVAALLELARRRNWRLRDTSLGVIGVGNVGSKVVRYARTLGMRVLQNDPPRQRAEQLTDFATLDGVCTEADFITCHVPLTTTGPEATLHLFDRGRLAALGRPMPVILNTSRGGVVDNEALLEAIQGKRVAGAIVDVWEHEPNISSALLDVVDLGTPHIAGYSLDGKVNGTQQIYAAACRHFGVVPTWTPQLPPPPVPRIEMRVAPSDDDEDVLRGIITRVYDITADDAALRERTREFDRLRAEYPVRREFFNTTLALRGAGESLRRTCAALGFRVDEA